MHPNDHVNRGQSSNDVFPDGDARGGGAAPLHERCCRRSRRCARRCERKARAFADIVKIGRTHLQDATPLTLGQEFSGYVAQLQHGRGAHRGGAAALVRARDRRHRGRHRAQRAPGIRRARGRGRSRATTGLPFVSAPNKFEALAAHDALVHAHGALQDAGRRAHEDRQRRALAGERAALRDSARSASRRTSRAARSCRARSTRRSARR